jgi:DNA-binding NtrC family response regulator
MAQEATPDSLSPSRTRPRRRVLVVEDEAYVRESLGALLEGRGYEVTLADGVDAAVEALGGRPVDLVLTDLNMPGGGLELVRRARALSEAPVVVLTGFGTVGSAVECLQAGASDYILKPAEPAALEVVLERALGRTSLAPESCAEAAGMSLPIGDSPTWQAVVQKVRAAAATNATVLLLGESGTGKELLARLAHRLSRRAAGPFVAVNCAAVSVGVWESEFFGHRKGAFTGALADRQGRFRLADKGTLFVDEIAAMPYEGQAKLLCAIEEGEFQRLGESVVSRVDVRIVAATNGNLESAVSAGRFREDLFHRLNVLRIEVPPLRDRPEDMPLLAEHFVRELAARLGRKAPILTEKTLRELWAHHWPGNVRELRSVLERAMILEPEGELRGLDLAPALAAATLGLETSQDLSLRPTLGRLERSTLLDALRRSRGIRKDAARLLGIDQRNLTYYVRKHQIDPDDPA